MFTLWCSIFTGIHAFYQRHGSCQFSLAFLLGLGLELDRTKAAVTDGSRESATRGLRPSWWTASLQFPPCFTSKKVDDKTDIFTSRWEETHLYMIDDWSYVGMFELRHRNNFSGFLLLGSEKKRLRTLRFFFPAKFLEGAVAVTTAGVPSSAARSLDLFGERCFFWFLTAKRRCQQNWGEGKWFCLWEWMVEDIYIYILTYDIIWDSYRWFTSLMTFKHQWSSQPTYAMLQNNDPWVARGVPPRPVCGAWWFMDETWNLGSDMKVWEKPHENTHTGLVSWGWFG